MTANALIAIGKVVGTGAAISVSVGWIPEYVEVVNLTDGNKVTKAYLGAIVPFSSGGTTEIAAGDTIVGATSKATAYVDKVHLVTGSWAAGDAAGFFEVSLKKGTFQSENVDVSGSTNLATITANVEYNIDVDTEVAPATGNAAISSFAGSESDVSAGFTIGSTVSASGKVLAWRAERSGQ